MSNTVENYSPITDREADTIIRQVSASLAGTYWWEDVEDLAQEARVLCLATNVLTGATSAGAFHERLRDKLIDSQQTEARRRRKTVATVDHNGNAVVGYDAEGQPVPYERPTLDRGWRGTEDETAVEGRDWQPSTGLRAEDQRPRHKHGERSRLLDVLNDLSCQEFLEWATEQGLPVAKVRDVDVLLNGSRNERDALWRRYVSKKWVGRTKTAEDRESRREEWQSRYRQVGDVRSEKVRWGSRALVVSADGETFVPGATLRRLAPAA